MHKHTKTHTHLQDGSILKNVLQKSKINQMEETNQQNMNIIIHDEKKTQKHTHTH